MSEMYREIVEAVVAGDEEATARQVKACLDQGCDPLEILNGGIILGAGQVGDLFEEGEFFLSDLMMAGQAMKAGMEVLAPGLEALSDGRGKQEQVVIATVQTDVHDIGKNIVSTMLLASGFKVLDLGVDVPPARILDQVKESNASLVALSALMTTSRPYMKDTVDLIRSSPLGDTVKILVGGGAVNPAYAEAIGADGYAPNAVQAVMLATEIVKES